MTLSRTGNPEDVFVRLSALSDVEEGGLLVILASPVDDILSVIVPADCEAVYITVNLSRVYLMPPARRTFNKACGNVI